MWCVGQAHPTPDMPWDLQDDELDGMVEGTSQAAGTTPPPHQPPLLARRAAPQGLAADGPPPSTNPPQLSLELAGLTHGQRACACLPVGVVGGAGRRKRDKLLGRLLYRFVNNPAAQTALVSAFGIANR